MIIRHFLFFTIFCLLKVGRLNKRLTLSGLGGGNIAPLTFERLSSKNYLTQWSITFWQFLNMFLLWLQTKKIVICNLTGVLRGVSNWPVKMCCAYFKHIYIFLWVLYIFYHNKCLNILNFGRTDFIFGV